MCSTTVNSSGSWYPVVISSSLFQAVEMPMHILDAHTAAAATKEGAYCKKW